MRNKPYRPGQYDYITRAHERAHSFAAQQAEQKAIAALEALVAPPPKKARARKLTQADLALAGTLALAATALPVRKPRARKPKTLEATDEQAG